MTGRGRDLKKIIHLLYTLTYFISVVPLKAYDFLHGTEYSRIRETEDTDGRYEYYPSSFLSFPFLRRYIRRNLQGGKGHAVLDIGCGKGLALLFFAGMCFDTVAGIEYDEKLCSLARENLKNESKRIQIYRMDAVDFSMYGYYDTFYLYNPFDETILEKCIGRILLSLEERPRKLTIFYCNPVYGDLLKEKGFEEDSRFYYKTTVFVYHGEK